MQSPFELALAQGRAIGLQLELAERKRRCFRVTVALTAAFGASLIVMAFRLSQYAEYLDTVNV